MRELKFRGKASEDTLKCKKGDWVYGGVTVCYKPELVVWIVINEFEMFPGRDLNVKFNSIRVEPESVGQYAGLKDKNGKEAYHKDIAYLKSMDSWFVVEWHEDAFWTLDCIKGPYDADPMTEIKFMEIKGNIYENKDLIK